MSGCGSLSKVLFGELGAIHKYYIRTKTCRVVCFWLLFWLIILLFRLFLFFVVLVLLIFVVFGLVLFWSCFLVVAGMVVYAPQRENK